MNSAYSPTRLNTLSRYNSVSAADKASGSENRLPVQFSQEFKRKISQVLEQADGEYSTIKKRLVAALFYCQEDLFSAADELVLECLAECDDIVGANPDLFSLFANALFASQRLDVLSALFMCKYSMSNAIVIEISEDGPGIGRFVWRVSESGICEFIFDSTVLTDEEHDFHGMALFDQIFPLFLNYTKSNDWEPGETVFNQWDLGLAPGLAYSDHRPDYFLVPDYVFVATAGYAGVKDHFGANKVPWEARQPVAFWRGSTTGICSGPKAWRSLERAQLCEWAQRHEATGLVDIGFSSIVQIPDSDVVEAIRSSGLMKSPVPWKNWNNYKYLIDIDGNSSPWSNLFQRLLTGSPVLKIASPRGLRQWFYDELKPWYNFVPIASDMSDLYDKLQYLIKNDSVAQDIGRRGYELASSLSYEGELAKSVPVITAAFRHFAYSQGVENESISRGQDQTTGFGRRQSAPPENVSLNRREIKVLTALFNDAEFDMTEYLRQNPDISRLDLDVQSIIKHLFFHGFREGRKPRFHNRGIWHMKLGESGLSKNVRRAAEYWLAAEDE